MNSTNPNSTSTRPLVRRAPIFAAAASLLLAPCLFAQTPATPAQGSAVQSATPSGAEPKRLVSADGMPLTHPAREKLYAVKFDGGPISKLRDSLRAQFSADNVVVSESVERVYLPPFEIRNVRLAEIGRTIEFLGEGQLRVEVTENAGGGNVWLIGRMNPAEAAVVKMRSVAAPYLFANEKALADIQNLAKNLDMARLGMAQINGGSRGAFRKATLEPLPSQGIFAIAGDEDGVAGMESLIKAAEQRLAESAAAKVAAIAAYTPKTRAVLAPHVFAEEKRLESVKITLGVMRERLAAVDDDIRKVTGSEAVRVAWANADPLKEQNVFLLLGTEAGIAGMESLIKAAEQLAAEEDARRDGEMRAVRAEKEAARQKDEAALRKAEDEAALKKAEDRAKAEKREQ